MPATRRAARASAHETDREAGQAADRSTSKDTGRPAEHGTGQDCAATRATGEGGASQRVRELGVLLDEGAFHLLQQTEFLFGERHGSS